MTSRRGLIEDALVSSAAGGASVAWTWYTGWHAASYIFAIITCLCIGLSAAAFTSRGEEHEQD